MEKIIVNAHGFSVLRRNFNRGDVTFLTKKFGDVVKKGEKPGLMQTIHLSMFRILRCVQTGPDK